MAHGGARKGAGRKPKYYDPEGKPVKLRVAKIPEQLTPKDIQDALDRKLKSKDKQNP